MARRWPGGGPPSGPGAVWRTGVASAPRSRHPTAAGPPCRPLFPFEGVDGFRVTAAYPTTIGDNGQKWHEGERNRAMSEVNTATPNHRDASADARAEQVDVAIVGAGPVGLVAAIELARQGLRPVVLDAKAEIAWSSRAICISRRSQEILDRIGAGPAFAAKALPWSRGKHVSTATGSCSSWKCPMARKTGMRPSSTCSNPTPNAFCWTRSRPRAALRYAGAAALPTCSRMGTVPRCAWRGPDGEYQLRAAWVGGSRWRPLRPAGADAAAVARHGLREPLPDRRHRGGRCGVVCGTARVVRSAVQPRLHRDRPCAA